MTINHSDYTMTDSTGMVVWRSVTVTDNGDVVGINGTMHRRDELTISDDGNKIVVNASQCELTR
jgi:hypothetical protein